MFENLDKSLVGGIAGGILGLAGISYGVYQKIQKNKIEKQVSELEEKFRDLEKTVEKAAEDSNKSN